VKGASGSLLARALLLSLPLLSSAAPLRAGPQSAPPIHLDAGTLAGALAEIARSTGAEIVSLEPGLAAVGVGVRTVPRDTDRALSEVLRGTAWRALRIGPSSWRIVRALRAPRPLRPSPPRPAPPPPAVQGDEITVTAGKFPTLLRDYPGTLVRLPGVGGTALPAGLNDLAHLSPAVFATAFGAGRDKLFLRGIADSSFNGASQTTTAIYFDDAPIAFGSPNPNLRLYDIASVEVLEGPQGTLYGSGSIGGVIRISPNPVDLVRRSVSLGSEVSSVAGGGIGWSANGAANLPLLPHGAGLRLVGYHEQEAGYISDPHLGARINRVDVSGGRAAFAAEPGGGIKADLGLIYQETSARDAQFVDVDRGLTRRPSLAQPYRSRFVLGRAGLRKQWDSGIELAGVLSYGHRTSVDRFDATLDAMNSGATVYDMERASSTWTAEARVGRASGKGVHWVAGIGIEHISDGQSRAFGSPQGTVALDEVTNITRSASAFAQARWPVARRLELTAGLRYTVARTDSEPARGAFTNYIRGATAQRLDPTLAVLWRAGPRLSAFLRYQTGYRNGGVTVTRGVGRVADFGSDSIMMVEAGARLRPLDGERLELSGTVSYARWNDVLADQVTRRGTPITANIGNARLVTVEGAANWRHPAGWRASAAMLFTANRLIPADPATPQVGRRLPDTPAFTGRLEAGYDWTGLSGASGSVRASLRYVGPSVLGPGVLLDLEQGNYAAVDAGATWRRGPVSLKLAVENVTNSHASRFALGNPLLLYRREGHVPLQPRTISAGLSFAY